MGTLLRMFLSGGAMVVVATAIAGAQESKRSEGAATEPALGGPKVNPARSTIKTLVQRDFDGKLKRIDDPVAAALDAVELSKEGRAAADEVVRKRGAVLDELVKDNLKEIVELAGARQAGEAARARELMRDLLRTAGPIMKKGTLVEQVSAALPTQAGEELNRLVEEYVQAAVEDRMENGGPEGAARAGGGKPGKMQASIAERLTGFGAEIKRSYERVFTSRARDFEKLLKDLNLAPEVESKVQQVFTDLFQKTYGKPTPAQGSKAFMQAWVLLDGEQRTRLRELLDERRGGVGSEEVKRGERPRPAGEVPVPMGEEPMEKR